MSKTVDKGTKNQDQVLASQVLEAIRSIKYGCVQITVHDSRVVQIDKTEKIRIEMPKSCLCK